MFGEHEEVEEVYSFGEYRCNATKIGSGEESIAIITENHGDEKGPKEVVESVVKDREIDYENLTVTVIEDTNVYASEATRRETPLDIQPVEADEHDLNRTYEDAREALKNGSQQRLNTTGQLAYQVLDYVDDLEPDLVVDMHTGTSATVKMPQIRYKFRQEYEDVNENEIRDVAENAGVDMINTVPTEDAQMMGAVLPKMGFPTVTLEVGGGVRLGSNGAFEEKEAENYRKALRNILEFKAQGTETDYMPEEFSDIKKNHAPIEISDAEVKYHFDLGDEVEEGDTVATLSFEDGDVEMESLCDGVLETVLAEGSRNNTRHGNRIFNIATK
jgi:predicted deacylase